MRIKHKANVRISDDADMKDMLFGLDDTLAEVVIDAFTKQSSGKISVLAGETESVALGDITAVRGAFLKLSGDCQLKINGAATAIQLRKPTTATGTYCKFFIEAEITSLQIIAPVGADVSGIFCVWGDLSA